MATLPNGSGRGPFWPVFEQSQIPMALVDRDRLYVAINDAFAEVFQYHREDVIGKRASGAGDENEPVGRHGSWNRLIETGELYGDADVRHGSGAVLRVSYAAHTSTVDDRWVALFVTLSAHMEPDGAELIGTSEPSTEPLITKLLTPREREVVRRVALGASTRRIAADLYLSPATVRSHVRNAMVKTNAHTRAQLVAIALGDGLIES